MTNTLIALGLPMVLFVILDSLQGLKAALIGAVFACLIEVGYSYYIIGEIDHLTLISVGLIIALAATSFITKSSLYFKLQPAILAIVISLFFFGCWWFDKNFLFEMMVKYKKLIPPAQQGMILSDYTRNLFFKVTFYAGFTFAAHAFFMLYIAIKSSNILWVISRAVGTMMSIFCAFILAQIF